MSVAGALRAPRAQARAKTADLRFAKQLAAAAITGFALSTLWAATLAERDEFEARRIAATAENVRASTVAERERADGRLALRAVEAWAARNGFVDGRAPAAEKRRG